MLRVVLVDVVKQLKKKNKISSGIDSKHVLNAKEVKILNDALERVHSKEVEVVNEKEHQHEEIVKVKQELEETDVEEEVTLVKQVSSNLDSNHVSKANDETIPEGVDDSNKGESASETSERISVQNQEVEDVNGEKQLHDNIVEVKQEPQDEPQERVYVEENTVGLKRQMPSISDSDYMPSAKKVKILNGGKESVQETPEKDNVQNPEAEDVAKHAQQDKDIIEVEVKQEPQEIIKTEVEDDDVERQTSSVSESEYMVKAKKLKIINGAKEPVQESPKKGSVQDPKGEGVAKLSQLFKDIVCGVEVKQEPLDILKTELEDDAVVSVQESLKEGSVQNHDDGEAHLYKDIVEVEVKEEHQEITDTELKDDNVVVVEEDIHVEEEQIRQTVANRIEFLYSWDSSTEEENHSCSKETSQPVEEETSGTDGEERDPLTLDPSEVFGRMPHTKGLADEELEKTCLNDTHELLGDAKNDVHSELIGSSGSDGCVQWRERRSGDGATHLPTPGPSQAPSRGLSSHLADSRRPTQDLGVSEAASISNYNALADVSFENIFIEEITSADGINTSNEKTPQKEPHECKKLYTDGESVMTATTTTTTATRPSRTKRKRGTVTATAAAAAAARPSRTNRKRGTATATATRPRRRGKLGITATSTSNPKRNHIESDGSNSDIELVGYVPSRLDRESASTATVAAAEPSGTRQTPGRWWFLAQPHRRPFTNTGPEERHKITLSTKGKNYITLSSTEVSMETNGYTYEKSPPTQNLENLKKLTPTPVFWHKTVVRDLVKWYENLPILYDKAHRNYNNISEKISLYEEKGKSLQPPLTGYQVYSFLETLCKKCSELKSLYSYHPPTGENRWFSNLFSFLDKHIPSPKKVDKAVGTAAKPVVATITMPGSDTPTVTISASPTVPVWTNATHTTMPVNVNATTTHAILSTNVSATTTCATMPGTVNATPTHTIMPTNVSATATHTITPTNVNATPTHTITSTNVSATPTHTIMPTNVSATATRTITPTSVSATASYTITPTNVSATATHTITPTNVSATASRTVTPTNVNATATRTITPTNVSATASRTVTPTNVSATASCTITPTNVSATDTHTITPTNVSATATRTITPTSVSATAIRTIKIVSVSPTTTRTTKPVNVRATATRTTMPINVSATATCTTTPVSVGTTANMRARECVVPLKGIPTTTEGHQQPWKEPIQADTSSVEKSSDKTNPQAVVIGTLLSSAGKSEAEHSWLQFFRSQLFEVTSLDASLWQFLRLEMILLISKYKLQDEQRKTCTNKPDPINDSSVSPALTDLIHNYWQKTQRDGLPCPLPPQSSLSAQHVMPTQSIQSVIQPADPTHSVQSAVPAQHLQPTVLVRTIKSSVPAQPVQSALPAQSERPTQSIQSAVQPAFAAHSIKSAVPLQPIQPTISAYSIQPGLPAQPIQSGLPAHPIQPNMPTQSIQSAIQPVVQAHSNEPAVQPTVPAYSAQSAVPARPVHHALPAQPIQPDLPTQPIHSAVQPAGPAHSVQSAVPAPPVQPTVAVHYIQPSMSAQPMQHAVPAHSIQSAMPTQHIQPTVSGQPQQSSLLTQALQPSFSSQPLQRGQTPSQAYQHIMPQSQVYISSNKMLYRPPSSPLDDTDDDNTLIMLTTRPRHLQD